MKIAICEDELIQIEYISKIIKKWKNEMKVEVTIDSYLNAESFLFSEINDYDLIILDIQMKELDGITLAKKIRKTNDLVKIVFITGISDFIGEGYEVDALHYLLKPVKEEKIFSVLNKAIITIPEQFLLIENNKLNLKDILYIESFGHKVNIKTIDNQIVVTQKFSELLKKTQNFIFQCHRCYGVNIRRIKSITKTEIILDNNEIIPVSRRLHKETCSAFTKYFGEGI